MTAAQAATPPPGLQAGRSPGLCAVGGRPLRGGAGRPGRPVAPPAPTSFPPSCRWTRTACRPPTSPPQRSPTTAAKHGPDRQRSTAQDEWKIDRPPDAELRPALRPFRRLPAQREPGSQARASMPGCGPRSAARPLHSRLRPLLLAPAVRTGGQPDRQQVQRQPCCRRRRPGDGLDHPLRRALGLFRRRRGAERSRPVILSLLASTATTRRPAIWWMKSQFGAPIILTPFNYRDGFAYGLELSVNFTPTTARCRPTANLSSPEGPGLRHRLQPVRLRSRRPGLYPQPLHLPGPRPDLFPPRRGVSYALIAGVRASAQPTWIYGSRPAQGRRRPQRRGAGALHPGQPDREQDLRGPAGRAAVDLRVRCRHHAASTPGHCSTKSWTYGTGVGVGAPPFGPRRGVFFGVRNSFGSATRFSSPAKGPAVIRILPPSLYAACRRRPPCPPWPSSAPRPRGPGAPDDRLVRLHRRPANAS